MVVVVLVVNELGNCVLMNNRLEGANGLEEKTFIHSFFKNPF